MRILILVIASLLLTSSQSFAQVVLDDGFSRRTIIDLSLYNLAEGERLISIDDKPVVYPLMTVLTKRPPVVTIRETPESVQVQVRPQVIPRPAPQNFQNFFQRCIGNR